MCDAAFAHSVLVERSSLARRSGSLHEYTRAPLLAPHLSWVPILSVYQLAMVTTVVRKTYSAPAATSAFLFGCTALVAARCSHVGATWQLRTVVSLSARRAAAVRRGDGARLRPIRTGAPKGVSVRPRESQPAYGYASCDSGWTGAHAEENCGRRTEEGGGGGGGGEETGIGASGARNRDRIPPLQHRGCSRNDHRRCRCTRSCTGR